MPTGKQKQTTGDCIHIQRGLLFRLGSTKNINCMYREDSKVYKTKDQYMMQFMKFSKETETKWALFRHSFTCFAAALSREHDSRAAAVEIQFCMVLVCNSSLLSMVKWNTMPHTHENHVHHEQVGGQATIALLLYSPHGSGNL